MRTHLAVRGRQVCNLIDDNHLLAPYACCDKPIMLRAVTIWLNRPAKVELHEFLIAKDLETRRRLFDPSIRVYPVTAGLPAQERSRTWKRPVRVKSKSPRMVRTSLRMRFHSRCTPSESMSRRSPYDGKKASTSKRRRSMLFVVAANQTASRFAM